MKVASLIAVLAKLLGRPAARRRGGAARRTDLGDVDSPQALADYQARSGPDKGRTRERRAGP